ncbi:MAG: flagellar biosynthesis anti-sigma factor FlgM [Pirellulales bacterium]|jgi:negative regulator of flagellin synthesis FlgM
MQVYGPTQLHGAQPISAPHAARLARPAAAPNPVAGGDELQISSQGQLIERIHDLPDIRQDRVQQIRAEIAQGKYETEEKLNLAMERLLDEIA